MKNKIKSEIDQIEAKLDGYEAYGIKLLDSEQIREYDRLKRKVKKLWNQLRKIKEIDE